MSTKLPPSTAHVTYSRQYRRCRKPGCGQCADGNPGHGPYWFAYWRENGRLFSRYLGKTMPAEASGAKEPDPLDAAPPSTALRVYTLGGLAVWRGAELIPAARWNRRAVRGLLTCLLSAPGQRLHREQACELLWPDDERATRKLNDTVSLLRQVLDGPEAGAGKVQVIGEILALEPAREFPLAADWLDAIAFERSARCPGRYGSGHLPDGARALRRAVPAGRSLCGVGGGATRDVTGALSGDAAASGGPERRGRRSGRGGALLAHPARGGSLPRGRGSCPDGYAGGGGSTHRGPARVPRTSCGSRCGFGFGPQRGGRAAAGAVARAGGESARALDQLRGADLGAAGNPRATRPGRPFGDPLAPDADPDRARRLRQDAPRSGGGRRPHRGVPRWRLAG